MLNAGQLSVKPIRAELLADMDFVGKMDPYCQVICGNQQQRTATSEDAGKNPIWSETFIFNLQPTDQFLQINIQDDDPGVDEFLGSAQFNLSQLQQLGGFASPWIDLLRNGKLAGKILMEFRLTPSQQSSFGSTGGMMPTTQLGFQQQQPQWSQPMPSIQTTPIQQQMGYPNQQQSGYQTTVTVQPLTTGIPQTIPQTTGLNYGIQQPMMQQQPLMQQQQQQPLMQQPGMQQMGLQQPGMQQPGMQQPGMQQMGMQQQPGMMQQQPGMMQQKPMMQQQQPLMQQPGIQQQGLQQQGLQQPGMQQQGMQQPGYQGQTYH
jgi:hypothetical protein